MLESRSGKKHPALAGYRPVHPAFRWLQDAYFRLHNRRKRSDYGTIQPLGYEEMDIFAGRVLNLSPNMVPFFFRVMESTDNEVLKAISEKRTSAK